jgi:23S rRNA (uridine2552-2'-O)-methyltransferase
MARNSPRKGSGKGGGAPGGLRGARKMQVNVKTAKGRTPSSKAWLQRQLNDPYVVAAKEAGLRSRAAFKLSEMDDRYKFLKKGHRVLDLGCAPGGWCQVSRARVGPKGSVIGVDLQEVDPIPDVDLMVLDFLADDAVEKILERLGGKVNVVLSDMAASASGHKQTDHIKIMALCEAALEFSCDILVEGGSFCAKVLHGGTEGLLLKEMRKHFDVVRHVKPEASRKDSSEMYVLAMGFRG